MNLLEYIAPRRCLVKDVSSKKTALNALAKRMAQDVAGLDAAVVLDAVLQREQTMSTRIAPGLAMPHARLPNLSRTLAGVLVSPSGIRYDFSDESAVHAIVMIVGGGDDHLAALAAVAERFQDATLMDRLRRCRSGRDVYRALTKPAAMAAHDRLDERSRILIRQGIALARTVNAGAILVYTDIPIERDPAMLAPFDRPLVRVCSRAPSEDAPPASDHPVRRLEVPFFGLSSQSLMELVLLLALARGYLRHGDRIVNILGFAATLPLDTLVLSDTERAHRFLFSTSGNRDVGDLDQSVLIRILQLATELAQEGREGKPVGALFVVGDHAAVLEQAQQMVMNPFRGYEEHERNIMDPGLTETIKEFSHIDGAVIVRGDGVIVSAGAYLQSKSPVAGLPSGLGARHIAAAGISADTRALSIAVSESTRQIRLFRFGKRIMTLR